MAGMARNGSDSAAPMVGRCGVGVVERRLRDDDARGCSLSDDVGSARILPSLARYFREDRDHEPQPSETCKLRTLLSLARWVAS